MFALGYIVSFCLFLINTLKQYKLLSVNAESGNGRVLDGFKLRFCFAIKHI